MTTNFLTSEDLNRIKGLLHYLNESFMNPDIDVECVVGDSNGERIGAISLVDDAGYVFNF